MNSITMSIKKSSSPSTLKNKSILRKMLSSAKKLNNFLTGKKYTQKNQSPHPMTQKEEDELVKNRFGQRRNADLKKELNSYKLMTPAEKKAEQLKYFTQDQMHISNLNKKISKLGGKQNKTKRSNNSKNRKPKIIIK